MNETLTPTPRTDAMFEDARNVALEFTCKTPPPKEGENVYVVPASFARQLEQELNEVRAERDKLKEQLKSDYNYICLNHTDRERSELVTGCPICKLAQLRNAADELFSLALLADYDSQRRDNALESYCQLPHVLERKTK